MDGVRQNTFGYFRFDDYMLLGCGGGGYLLHPEDEGAAIFRNPGNCLRVDTA